MLCSAPVKATRRRWLGVGLVPLWVALAGVSFMWPTELQQTIDRVGSSHMPVTFQDIQILKNAGTDESVELLFELLDRSDEVTNLTAARAIADLERSRWKAPTGKDGRRLEDTLVDWLDVSDPDMRRSACEILSTIGAIGQRERVAMMVTDADLDVRAACVRSLLDLYVGTRDLDPVKSLSVQILSDPYHQVRVYAIQGLGRLPVKETFVSFLPLLESDNPSMRGQALLAVTNIDPEQAYPFAVKAMGDSEHEVRVAALTALGTIGDPAAVTELEPMLVDHVLARYVVEALGRIEDREAFELLLGLLDNPALRDPALHALSTHGAPSVDAVASALLTSWDADTLRLLVKVAAYHPDASYLPGLKRLLGMAPERKQDVLAVLHGIHTPGALQLALTLVADATPKIQKDALTVVGAILEDTGADPASREVIADALCYEDRDVRMEALELVTRWKIEEAAPLLVPLLVSRWEDEKVGAAAALLELGETIGIDVLVEALSSTTPALRLQASRVLADARPPEALEPLVELLDEEISSNDPGPGTGLRFDILGHVMQASSSKHARELIGDLLDDEDERWRALGARASVLSGDPGMVESIETMLAGKRVRLRRVLAPRLWHLEPEKGRELIDVALADPDPSTRAGATLSLFRAPGFDAAEKVDRFVEKLSDPDEFVRINAAAGLRDLGVPLGEHSGALCDAFRRDLTAMETLAAMMLLAEAGATCLQQPAERLLRHPSSAAMGAAIEAVRIGLDTGAVTLTDGLRAGLGQCATGSYLVLSETCQALLEGKPAPGDDCPPWAPLTGAALPVSTSDVPGQVMPGVHQVKPVVPLSGTSPVFVLDGALTPRAALIEEQLVEALPDPRCAAYVAGGVLRF
jgi:HEAT repeat protein